MALQTEAACLLETGALYGLRVMFQPEQGDPIFAGFKQGAFSLYYGDEPIFHFDREGRWQRAFVQGIHYLKGLDATVQAIDRVREGKNMILKRRTLSFAEASDLDALIRGTAISLGEALTSGKLRRVEPPAKEGIEPMEDLLLLDILERVARWDASAWFAYREKYLAAHGVLPFLPADCQSSLIVQGTLGNKGDSGFGGGSASPYHARSPQEFIDHVRAVRRLVGTRLLQCRQVFLAGGDVLTRPFVDLESMLKTIEANLIDAPLDESIGELAWTGRLAHRLNAVHAFLDQPGEVSLSTDQWLSLREHRLERVIVGVESGDPDIRLLFGKRWENATLHSLVASLKQAGIGVGIVVLVGAGGERSTEQHVSETARLVNSLSLAPGDLVSLMDLREFQVNTPTLTGEGPLSGEQWARELSAHKEALSPSRKERGVKIVPYSLEKQGLG